MDSDIDTQLVSNPRLAEHHCARRRVSTRLLIQRRSWLLVGLIGVMVVFSQIWPEDFRHSSATDHLLSWIAFMVGTFRFHLGLLIVPVVLLAMALRLWRLSAVSCALVLITVGMEVGPSFAATQPAVSGETATIMSVNLLFNNLHEEDVIRALISQGADVVVLQEYGPRWHDVIHEAISERYPYMQRLERPDAFGAAVYSRTPLLEQSSFKIELGTWSPSQMRVLLNISGRPIALYNLHLVPPKLGKYFAESQSQFADLLNQVSKEQLPVILAGDFNFSTGSAAARALARHGFKEVHQLSGIGRGTTWPAKPPLGWLPGIRIDHMFLRDGLIAVTSTTGPACGSDHRPIITEIGFAASDSSVR